jgi:hypothetical protein
MNKFDKLKKKIAEEKPINIIHAFDSRSPSHHYQMYSWRSPKNLVTMAWVMVQHEYAETKYG